MTKKTKNILILISAIILLIKIGLIYFAKGAYFFSDEACIMQKALHFAQNFEIAACKEIVNAPANDPQPFFSIFISPIYFFTKGMTGYYAVLALNAILVTSLVFPLYKIASHYIKEKWLRYLLVIVTLFLPQVVIFEKMLMTESFFFITNIWFLYFYIESFEKNKIRNKALATVFAVIGALTRPFGFIMLLAMTVNEAIQSKKKKFVFTVLLPLTLIFIGIAFYVLGITNYVASKLSALQNPENFLLIVKSIKDQLNSLLVTTFMIPVIIFFTQIFIFKDKTTKNIKYFLLTFIFLNFSISANHMFGYLIEGSELDLLTRYLNMSIIYIFIFALLFIFNKKKFELNIFNTILTVLCIVSLFFISYKSTKHSLNLDLSLFYKTKETAVGNVTKDNHFIAFYFLPICLAFFTLLLNGKRKIFIATLSIGILIYSSLLYHWHFDFTGSNNNDSTFSYFKEKEYNILLVNSYKQGTIDFTYWRLITLSQNNTDAIYYNDMKAKNFPPNFESEKGKELLAKYDYIISHVPLPLDQVKVTENMIIYRVSKTAEVAPKINDIIQASLNT